MEVHFPMMLYGGDYNPNQWPREVWDQDIKMFLDAGINEATVNVFSWAKLQPAENVYDFSELDAIIEKLSAAGIKIILATSTAALPAWMFRRYPEVGRVDEQGRRHRFGQRHNACPHSPVYQKYSARLAGKLAERYGANPNVICWHINNEYGGECFCENCAKAFRVWLRERYHTIEALNRAWNLEFWGHTVYDWDEIVPPDELGDNMGGDDTAFAGLSLDYRRFMSDSLLANYCAERDAIRQFDPDTPITTNLMSTYKGLDYFRWAKEMDIISWDSYPAYNTPWSYVAMRNDLMRGLKGRSFLLMEQTPSQQNWQPYNSLKRPGQMRAQSYQTVAHGGDAILFFQLRRSVGGCEKFHGAVIEHAGRSDARVYREVAQLGHELHALGDRLIGAGNPAKAAIFFDWDNYWALEYTSGPSRDLKYVDQIHQYYRTFYDTHTPVDLISVDADLSGYRLIAAPALYLVKPGLKEKLEAFVRDGGVLVTTFMSGIAGESDNVYLGGYPGPLRALAGVWVEEIDALAPEQKNGVRFADGTESGCGMLCDIIHLETAECLGAYTGDFYAGTPAVTQNAFGQGRVYYVGTQLDPDGLRRVMGEACRAAGVERLIPEETPLEVAVRESKTERFTFVINLTKEAAALPASLTRCGADFFTGKVPQEGQAVEPFGVLLLTQPLEQA